ncbi:MULTISPECIES: hypothetical protein [Bacillus cereus group]|uniref:hypothetical protein n=1 Tax=Bacillus cereus group TaxID=86661 RepID=UPI001141EBF1|nr:hypothetical protein [Bacillus cereus group sp. BY25LC]MDA1828529.1 hypothetical protein [Bacillus cereus group sp. BY25LC]
MGQTVGDTGSGSRGTGATWSDLLESIVKQIEFVSSHYGYTEEYVLSHTPYWLRRKVEQALNEKYDSHTSSVRGQYQSFLLLLDTMFNKGAEFNTILPPTREQAISNNVQESDEVVENNPNQYDSTQWWLTPNKGS